MSKSGGHSTTTITRPKDATASRPRSERSDRTDDTKFGEIVGDLTRPIPKEKQLVQGRGKRGIIALGAVVVTAALIAALFVLPVKAWLRQQDDIDRKQREVAVLDQANAELSDEIDRLQTPEGIEEAAREEIGYVERGEIRLSVLPAPAAPLTLPSGWPYDAIGQIVTTKSAEAAAATTVAP